MTKEEINLCKEIAKYHRKSINYGDWELQTGKIKLVDYHLIGEDKDIPLTWVTPLWSIQDCLDFLRDNGYRYFLHYWDKEEYYIGYGRDDIGQWADTKEYKTPLEALLSVVLKIVKERRKQ